MGRLGKSRKRQRPWLTAAVLLTSALFVMDGLVRLGVNAEEENPLEINVTSSAEPSPTPSWGASTSNPRGVSPPVGSPTTSPTNTTTATTTTTTNGTQVSSGAPLEVQREAIPILFDLVMESSDTASFHQLTKDVDGLLEDYLYRNLKSRQGDTWDVRDVLLSVTVTTRRRLQGTREVALRVDGNVLADVDATTCIQCADQTIQSDIGELTTADALDTVLVRSIQQVNRVTQVREVELDQVTLSPDSSNSLPETTSENEQLQRPSTLSIIFGFALTGIAFLGLVLYAYIFYTKRQKRLRKQRLQSQSIEYRLPPPRIAPATPSPMHPSSSHQKASPKIVPTSIPIQEENYAIIPPFHVVVDTDTVVSDAPTDDFARELQMAATLDEQAWEDFQRKKMTLDRNDQLPPSFSTIGSVSPIPVPVPPPESNPAAWTKSFPYGDEMPDEQGVEWIPDLTGISSMKGNAWMPYDLNNNSNSNNKVLQPQENKQGGVTTSRGRLDPEPNITGPSSAVLQSIEKTLAQYQVSNENSLVDERFLTEDETECVDEVARLTRYVQRLEKQKERRKQLESSRHVTSQVNGPSPPRYSENNGYLNNMRSPPTPLQDHRSIYDASLNPGAPRYMGITMAGGLYQDPSLLILDPEDSMSDDSEDNQSLRSHERLGITPFSAQNSAAFQAYNNTGPISTTMTSKGRGDGPLYNGRNRQIFPIDNSNNNPTIGSREARNPSSSQPPPVRLSELRTNQAIIDETHSDANFVTFSDAGTDPVPAAPKPKPTQPSTKSTPKKTTNQKFSKLRSLFEERPKNAVFPPDENWQSNGMLKT